MAGADGADTFCQQSLGDILSGDNTSDPASRFQTGDGSMSDGRHDLFCPAFLVRQLPVDVANLPWRLLSCMDLDGQVLSLPEQPQRRHATLSTAGIGMDGEDT